MVGITYEEFLTFGENHNGKYYEAIDRQVYEMASPSTEHQQVSNRLARIFDSYLVEEKCRLFVAPTDVFLGDDVVVPDLCIVCDEAKVNSRGIYGAPDLIVEIVSKSTDKRDLQLKRDLYLKNFVKEYWIVYPLDGPVIINRLDDDQYIQSIHVTSDVVISSLFPDLEVNLSFVFGVEKDKAKFRDYLIDILKRS